MSDPTGSSAQSRADWCLDVVKELPFDLTSSTLAEIDKEASERSRDVAELLAGGIEDVSPERIRSAVLTVVLQAGLATLIGLADASAGGRR